MKGLALDWTNLSSSFLENLNWLLRAAKEAQELVSYKEGEEFCYASDGHYFYFSKYGCGDPVLCRYQYWSDGAEGDPDLEWDMGQEVSFFEARGISEADVLESRLDVLHWQLSMEERECSKIRLEISEVKKKTLDIEGDYHAIVHRDYSGLSESLEVFRDKCAAANMRIFANRFQAKFEKERYSDFGENHKVVKLTPEEVERYVKKRVVDSIK